MRKYLFNTDYSDYAKYNGSLVTIIRELTPEENETETKMFLIEMEDGFQGNAYIDELKVVEK